MALLKHTPPNFIVNQVKGWNSRLLYTYYGHHSYTFDYYVQTSNYTDNLFAAIGAYATTNTIIISKGQYTFPQYSYFFKTGKSIRIKGYLLVSAGASAAILNMRASIKNITDATTHLISAQNNNQNHEFAGANDYDNVPVSFEITYSCVEDSNTELFVQANGFYQYDYLNYASEGQNTSTVYVPIYNTTQFTSVGTHDDEYEIYVSFNNSADISNIKLYHMTVEELS